MLFWILALIVAVILGGLILLAIRRRMLIHDDSMSVGSSGLLDHLHQMHRDGEIDDDEFANARKAVLRQVQEDMDAHQKPNSEPNPFDLDGFDSNL